jgi:hypothetical protein
MGKTIGIRNGERELLFLSLSLLYYSYLKTSDGFILADLIV